MTRLTGRATVSLQVMVKLFPEQKLWQLSDGTSKIQVEGRDVSVEVTSFEPVQDILVSWNLRVSSKGAGLLHLHTLTSLDKWSLLE